MATGIVVTDSEVERLAKTMGDGSSPAMVQDKMRNLRQRGFRAICMVWPDVEQVTVETDAPGERLVLPCLSGCYPHPQQLGEAHE